MNVQEIQELEIEASAIVHAENVPEYEGWADHAVQAAMVDFALRQLLKAEQQYRLYVLTACLISFLVGFAVAGFMFNALRVN
jgi:uncharacterized membrane protein YjfL (UPF0719 family)